MMFRLTGFIAFFGLHLLSPAGAFGQWASLGGRIAAADSGQELPGVHVVLQSEDGEERGTVTGAGGLFAFERLTPGAYLLRATYVGFEPYSDTLRLEFGQRSNLVVRLQPADAPVGEVVVEAEQNTTGEATPGLTTIPPSALARVPMPGLTPDLAGYLLTLPGVVSGGDTGGHLFVRGGAPVENLVLIDGMPVYQPFHIVGFYSAFPAEIVAQADFYAGGFGARYGGRLSSVIDVTTRNGSKDRIRGAASVAPFLGSLSLELPVAPGKVSVLAVARESIIERLAPDLFGKDMPFRFGDRFGKVHAYLSQTSRFAATALQTNDEGRIVEACGTDRQTGWKNEAYGGRYTYLASEYPLLAEIAVYVTRLRSTDRPSSRPERRAEVSGNHGEMRFVYLFGETQFEFGLFGRANHFLYDLGETTFALDENVSEGGGYFESRFRAGRSWRIEPGVRLHGFSNSIGTVVEPRLRLAWTPGGPQANQSFGLAWGLYHQQITGLHNPRDVTDVFIAWQPVSRRTTIPSARHTILTWQRALATWLHLTAEGYHKSLKHHLFAEYDEATGIPATTENIDGAARGLDVRLEVIRPAFYGYLGYGLASVRYDPNETADLTSAGRLTMPFNPPHDRRHQIHALFQIERGAYRVSSRWQFGSGQPFTPLHGFYGNLATGAPSRGFHDAAGRPALSFGPPFSARLPTYHRLDVSLERTFRLPYATLTLQAGAINVYDRPNVFDYDFFSGEHVRQLPFIPSAGLLVQLP